MKKVITILLIVIMLLNLISIKSYAADTTSYDTGDSFSGMDDLIKNIPSDIMNTDSQKELDAGKGSIENDKGEKKLVNTRGTQSMQNAVTTTMVHGLTGIMVKIFVALDDVAKAMENDDEASLTIYSIVMGKIDLFNLNFNDVPDKNIHNIDYKNDGMNVIFKTFSITYYYRMRNLSIAASLFILIYIGIRMAIATTAEKKARFGKMLYNWLASLILVIFMHFIVIILCAVLEKGREILENIATSMGVYDIEVGIYGNAIKEMQKSFGWGKIPSFLVLLILLYYRVKFLILYVLRFLEVNFLVIVAPLITITYPIDKMGDHKAQAFTSWFAELIIKASLQLMHAILYCVLIFSAGAIAEYQPILCLVLFWSLARSERIVRKIFNIKDNSLDKIKIPFLERGSK